MRVDEVLTRRSVLRGAGVAATGVAVATLGSTALGTTSAAAEPVDHGSPVGSWLVTIKIPGFPDTTRVVAFATGGVFSDITLNPPGPGPSLGTWRRTGRHTFTATAWQLTPNPSPPPGQLAVRGTADGEVNDDEITWTGPFDVFVPSDLDKSVFTGSGQATGRRIKA
jgi:hypothetical protein